MSSEADTPTMPVPAAAKPEVPGKSNEVLQQVAIYSTAGGVGLAAAVNKIRHNFYREAKNWPGFDALRKERIDEWSKLANKTGQSFGDYIKEHRQIEEDYTKRFSEKLQQSRGILSRGFKGWTVGTYQQWRASGPHTRHEALLSMASGAIITVGALLTLKHSRQISVLADQQDVIQTQTSSLSR